MNNQMILSGAAVTRNLSEICDIPEELSARLDISLAEARLMKSACDSHDVLVDSLRYIWGLLRELEYEKTTFTYANAKQIYDKIGAAIAKTEGR